MKERERIFESCVLFGCYEFLLIIIYYVFFIWLCPPINKGAKHCYVFPKVAGSSVSDDFQGFLAVVDDRSQYPLATRKAVMIRPGRA